MHISVLIKLISLINMNSITTKNKLTHTKYTLSSWISNQEVMYKKRCTAFLSVLQPKISTSGILRGQSNEQLGCGYSIFHSHQMYD